MKFRPRILSHPALALICFFVSQVAVIGYAYGITGLYGVATFIPMALHTALAFFILALGMLCLRPERGVMAIVTSAGGGGVLARRLIPAVIVVPVLLGWLRSLGEKMGIYSAQIGTSIHVVVNSTVLFLLVCATAARLHRTDRQRLAAEEELCRARGAA